LRCLFESRITLFGDFWTLIYADALEKGDYEHFKKFLKRLRVWNQRSGNLAPMSFLACGEYGTKSGRFHFYALVFNSLPVQFHNFSPDAADLLGKLWPHGFAYIGTVIPASICYTARYTLKFHAKGKEAMSAWSKGFRGNATLPPRLGLGGDGISQLADYMRVRGDKLYEVFTCLKIEGSTYALDEYMRRTFERSFLSGGEFSKSKLRPFHDYYYQRLFGDPVAV